MDRWKTLNEVPKVFRILDGGRLSVEQCNLIYKDLASKYIRTRADGRRDFDYSKAREEFKRRYEKKKLGNTFVWITKGGNGSTSSVEGGE
ncbi:MAG: hypothetical protein GXP46_01935 [Deferribacteres bacterium]|nr:hypothetical protein [Deferribacteres bacterium]